MRSAVAGVSALHRLEQLRHLSISKAPAPAKPKRTFVPQQAEPDPYADRPPKLYTEQPDHVTSTGTPYNLHRVWSMDSRRNKAMKAQGYLFTEPAEQFGAPQFVMPGDEAKAPIPILDMSVWKNAAVLVDKPKRWTSFDVCNKLRNATFKYPFKVGHCGTLDPLATGLLIICMGEATKCVERLTKFDKEYSGTMKLGEVTPSFDASEPITERRPWEHITDDQIEAAAKEFVGKLNQLPPMFSAVRMKGKRLYEWAREGKEVERKPRLVEVFDFNVKRSDSASQIVDYRIHCSSGTYVRSLVHDLGQTLGCGAYVRSLRRDAIGPYKLSDAWELDKLLKVIEDSKTASQ